VVREEPGEIIEERVGHGLEAHKPAFVLLGDTGRKRTEPLVFPEDVVAALGAVSDPQPSLARQTDEPAVTEERPEDHLELDGIRWDPLERDARMLDHTDEFDRGLRSPRAYFENRRRFPMSESVGSNRFTRSLNGKSDGETASLAAARNGWGDTHSFGIHVRRNGSLGST